MAASTSVGANARIMAIPFRPRPPQSSVDQRRNGFKGKPPKKAAADQLGFMDVWYPIQVKQKDKAGRPDIDSFEAVMTREERTNYPIQLIAMLTGYGTIYRLEKAFVEQEQTTPAEYRRRYGRHPAGARRRPQPRPEPEERTYDVGGHPGRCPMRRPRGGASTTKVPPALTLLASMRPRVLSPHRNCSMVLDLQRRSSSHAEEPGVVRRGWRPLLPTTRGRIPS